MNTPSAHVHVVDDDVGIHRALAKLLHLAGYKVHSFLSAESFLNALHSEEPGCVLLEMAMPGMQGPDLQRALASARRPFPVIFLTGNGDIHSCADAMKMGAIDFLTKPCSSAQLIEAIVRALQIDIAACEQRARRSSIERRVATLTPREHQVMRGVIAGRLNKQIAFELGTSEKTIKIHRARVMAKMQAESVPDLMRFAAEAATGLGPNLVPTATPAKSPRESQSMEQSTRAKVHRFAADSTELNWNSLTDAAQ